MVSVRKRGEVYEYRFETASLYYSPFILEIFI